MFSQISQIYAFKSCWFQRNWKLKLSELKNCECLSAWAGKHSSGAASRGWTSVTSHIKRCSRIFRAELSARCLNVLCRWGRIQLKCRTFYISQKEGTKKGDTALHILYAVTVQVFFSWKNLSKQRRRNEGSFKFWNTSVRRVKAKA